MFTADLVKCRSRKGTGLINNNNYGCIPMSQDTKIYVFCYDKSICLLGKRSIQEPLGYFKRFVECSDSKCACFRVKPPVAGFLYLQTSTRCALQTSGSQTQSFRLSFGMFSLSQTDLLIVIGLPLICFAFLKQFNPLPGLRVVATSFQPCLPNNRTRFCWCSSRQTPLHY